MGGMTLEAWRASVGYAPAQYATARAQFLDKRQAAAEPRARRGAPGKFGRSPAAKHRTLLMASRNDQGAPPFFADAPAPTPTC